MTNTIEARLARLEERTEWIVKELTGLSQKIDKVINNHEKRLKNVEGEISKIKFVFRVLAAIISLAISIIALILKIIR